VSRTHLWCDIRGLPVYATVDRITHVLAMHGVTSAKLGIAATPIAAEVAARYAAEQTTFVREGEDRVFLSRFAIDVLAPDPTLANLLDGAGIETCGDLARLSRESVEVRFGGTGAALWRLARADDPRRIFRTIPRPLPEASLEWTDYTLRRAERLVFVINALCGNVCDALRERGEGAIAMTLRFSLANRTTYEHPVRAARATAGQNAWMRLFRLELERIALPDAVTGIVLRVDVAGTLGGKQGDIFDRGFGTAHAAEEAVSGLLDDQGAIVVEPENTAHPLLDRRTSWTHLSAAQAISRLDAATPTDVEQAAVQPALTLQLLPRPMRIAVATVKQRDLDLPRSYRDTQGTHAIVDVAGPDRVSGGEWDEPYAREYFRCVTDEGMLVWMYRDARDRAWYLHGWWD